MDHLTKLSFLYLQLNNCIDKGAGNSLSAVKNVIQVAKSQCVNSEIENLQILSAKEIKTLRDEVTSDFEKILAAVKLRNDKMEEQIREIKVQNSRLEEKLTKIMKALDIAD